MRKRRKGRKVWERSVILEQVARSPYKGLLDCVARMLREEGVWAFFRSYRTTVRRLLADYNIKYSFIKYHMHS